MSLADGKVWQLIAHERLYVGDCLVVGYREKDNGDIQLVLSSDLNEAGEVQP